MNIINEIRKLETGHGQELLIVAKLAVAYTYLAEAPYDNWGHEGTPAEMAVFVVAESKKRGHFGFLKRIIAPEYYRQIGPL
jgi:hypothetical protein